MALLSVQGLIKKFEASASAAVDHVSFTVGNREIISLLGPSGCGKTTTLRCIAGLEQPDRGEIYLEDRLITTGPRHVLSSEKRGMGMVFQSYSIWPHMTVGQNILIGLRAKGLSKSDAQKKVNDVLALVRLPGLAERRATDLSGGQQQRVALARSLALEPSLLLFDEPLSNLDTSLREEMRLDLSELLRRLGIASIYVTHDQAEAFALSDRILVMQEGKVVQAGPPDEIYLRPATRFVAEFVGSANVIPGIVRGIEGSLLVVSLESGEIVHAIGGAQINEHVDLCVRSETLELVPRGSEPSKVGFLAGVVQTKTYLGDRIEYRVAVGSQSLLIDASPQVLLDNGQLVWACLDPHRVSIIGGTN